MGILELHFHDSEFVFGPSIGSESASADDFDDSQVADEVAEGSDGGGKRPALALLVGLAFALLLGLLAKRAGGGEEEEIDLPDAE